MTLIYQTYQKNKQTVENITEITHIPKNRNRGHTGDDNRTLPNSVRSKMQQQQQQTVDMWMGFKEYLIKENQSVSSIKNKISYAKRFHYVLESMNAHELSKITPDVKVHAMKALASLSKFLGRHDQWLDIIKRHQLRWSSAANYPMNAFMSIFDIESQGKGIDSMIKWIRDASSVLPQQYKNILLFNTSTGPTSKWSPKRLKIEIFSIQSSLLTITLEELKEITIQHIKKELDIMEMML